MCLPFMSLVEEWKEIAKKFSDTYTFPHCAGALDGKHVVIQACGQCLLFYNYKGTPSVMVMALAGLFLMLPNPQQGLALKKRILIVPGPFHLPFLGYIAFPRQLLFGAFLPLSRTFLCFCLIS